MVEKKIGRPTENPKGFQMSVRFDEESSDILEKYSKKENISKAEAVRRGVKKLKDDIKK